MRLKANVFLTKTFVADEAKMISLLLKIDTERSKARSQPFFVKIFIADEAKMILIQLKLDAERSEARS